MLLVFVACGLVRYVADDWCVVCSVLWQVLFVWLAG